MCRNGYPLSFLTHNRVTKRVTIRANKEMTMEGTQKYFGQFDSRESVAAEFERGAGNRWKGDFSPAEDFPTEDEILLASYGTPMYEGYAFVLFEKDGVLYEVRGSHCSCYGLEGQWEPEETTWAALHARSSGDGCDYDRALSSYEDHEQGAHDRLRALLDAHPVGA